MEWMLRIVREQSELERLKKLAAFPLNRISAKQKTPVDQPDC